MAAVVEGEAPDLFSFADYREFLRRYYEFRRCQQPTFSYRFMSARLEIDPGQLAHILQGKLHLPQRALAATLKLCRFDSRQAAFFEELVRLARSRKPEEIERCRERLDALRSVVQRELGSDAEGFYHHWRHAAIRALADMVPENGDGGALGRHCLPFQGAVDAAESVALLLRIGLLERDGARRLRPTHPHVAAGAEISAEALRGWHRQVLGLASESLERFPPGRRDVSTLTVAISASDLPAVKEWISDLRRQVQAQADSASAPGEVWNICVQFFPVARTGGGRAGPSVAERR